MSAHPTSNPIAEDRVSNILKWVLLAVAILTFSALIWTTVETYKQAPPQPDRFVGASGAVVLTEDEVFRGKEGFQRADLMDYGSIYGMGSYFGEDYTASTLVALATATQENIARSEYAMPFSALNAEHKMGVRAAMQAELQGVNLTLRQAPVPNDLATAITTIRGQITNKLLKHDFVKGYSQAYSLDPQAASDTSGFLVYSALTTVARRPEFHSILDTELAVRTSCRQHADDVHLHLDLDQLLLHVLHVRRDHLYLSALSERTRQRADGPGAGEIPPPHAESTQNRKIFPRRRSGIPVADSGRLAHGALLQRALVVLRPSHR